jgi:hypothetical protein
LLDRGGQAPSRCWRTLIASTLRQPSPGDVWITGRSLTESPVRRSPRKRNRCGWSGLFAYIVHVARRNLSRTGNCTACPRQPSHSSRCAGRPNSPCAYLTASSLSVAFWRVHNDFLAESVRWLRVTSSWAFLDPSGSPACIVPHARACPWLSSNRAAGSAAMWSGPVRRRLGTRQRLGTAPPLPGLRGRLT